MMVLIKVLAMVLVLITVPLWSPQGARVWPCCAGSGVLCRHVVASGNQKLAIIALSIALWPEDVKIYAANIG